MPYRPRVGPSSADPLTEAIAGLREGWRGSAEARRQRQLDQERQEDREFMRDAQRRAMEDREFQVYGQRPTDAPPTVQETIDTQALLGELHRGMAQRRAPRPAAAGAYVPGQGFALPEPQVPQPRVPLAEPAPMMTPRVPAATVTREAPDAVQVGEGRWIRRGLLPEEQQRAAARELEAARLAQLEAALSGLEHIPEGTRQAIPGLVAAGVSPSIAMPPPAETPGRGQLIQTDQGWALVDPTTGETTPLGVGLPPSATGGAGAHPEATATSRLNRFASAVRDISSALQSYQAALRRDFQEPTPEALDNFLRTNFNIGLQDYYRMQSELYGLWGTDGVNVGGESSALDRRIDELVEAGMSEDEIVATLEQEGLIGDS